MQIKQVELQTLTPWEGNPKKHTREQIGHIAESIKEFGFVQPLVTDEEGNILVGHGRAEAAKALGLKTVPVVIMPALTESQKKALVIIDNAIAMETGFDAGALEEQYGLLRASDIDLESLGLLVEEVGEAERGEAPKGNPVAEAKEVYDAAEQMQVVFYFLAHEFEDFERRFQLAQKELGTDKAETILKLLEMYEA